LIDAPLLSEFCAEMQRLAGVIEARAEFVPVCGGLETEGLHVNLKDGAVYVLTYSEKGMTDVLAESIEPDAVMEQVFVQVTERIATEDPSIEGPPLGPEDLAALESLSIAEIRAKAQKLQGGVGAIQLRLMTSLNRDWGRRQAARNAEREQQIQHFFDRDRP
jgi:hypothetical protein